MTVKGTAASVQVRPAGAILSLGAAGEVRYNEFGLAAEGAASLRKDGDAWLVSLTASPQPQQVKVTAPGQWAASGAKVADAKDGAVSLSVPAGSTTVRLTRK